MNFRTALLGSLACVAMTGGLLVATSLSADETATPSTEVSPRDWIRTYFEECLNDPADYHCLDDFWTPEKVEGVERSERVRRHAFPDLSYEIVDLLVDAGHAAVRCRVTGHAANVAEGETGALELHEGFFYVLQDGKIQSGKVISDRMAVADALGYEVRPPGAEGP